jgi:ABC-type transport system involved in Fe-S cluster assembly fused permease/ATPase subunit
MQETSSMVNFLFTIKDLLGQIARVDDIIKDEDVVLNVLSNSYENFMQNVLAQGTLSKLSSIDV